MSEAARDAKQGQQPQQPLQRLRRRALSVAGAFGLAALFLFIVGTGLPERETSPLRVAQRVPRRAEAEAYCAGNERRTAATRENDADDDGAPALLVVDPCFRVRVAVP